ncbi:Dynein regulatory complex protein 8 [Manis javanica]|nr:Dynein regulatory complex protein 8 [Manis javanica]
MTEILQGRRYRPIQEDSLLRVFEVLDQSKYRFLSKEELIKYMTEKGKPFSLEEMEEMLLLQLIQNQIQFITGTI